MRPPLPLLLTCGALAASPWPPSARQQAESLVARMSLNDLINLTAAEQSSPYQGTIPAQPTAPVAQLLLAALNDAALTVADAADPQTESARLIAALGTLLNGLRMPAGE